MTGIYKIENTLNGKVYVGKAENIQQRFDQHRYALKKNSNSSWYIEARKESNSITNFTFNILQTCSLEELDELEEYWINFYNSHIYGYNRNLQREA